VEWNILYHFLPKLEAYKGVLKNSTHLNLLVNYIRGIYALTKQHLISLLGSGEITFNLFWTLFKLNELVYRKYYNTNKCRYMRFNSGKVKEDNKRDKYFCIKGQYLNFNSKNFSKAVIAAAI
jgi:hypothetical protein